MTQDLITWLKARLDEDEAWALAFDDRSSPWPGQWVMKGGALYTYNGWSLAVSPGGGPLLEGLGQHIAHWDPARVLAEVAAKRRILDLYEAMDNKAISADAWVALGEAVKLLAAPYSSHPDWQAEWTVTEE